jgi:MoxR-like ATPase
MRELPPPKEIPIRLPDGTLIKHILPLEQENAILFAEASGRPLLVSGEPGLGKSQLARAAAALLDRPLKSLTINSNTEASDLLYSFDAVSRLAESQVLSSVFKNEPGKLAEFRKEIAVSKYVTPGPLWWAIDGKSALDKQPEGKPKYVSVDSDSKHWDPEGGIVILIDEIDKAESSLPNGLLEVFGERKFTPPGSSEPIVSKSNAKAPVVIITTNEERRLPEAFVRRCLILQLEMPPCLDGHNTPALDSDISKKFIEHLLSLGKAHYGDHSLPVTVMSDVAEMLLEDRQNAILKRNRPYPGPAEYLDLLRALRVLGDRDLKRKLDQGATTDPKEVYLDLQINLRQFVFQKSQGDGE